MPPVDSRKIASSLSWSALIVYANRALSLVTLLILAKLLTPHDFGIVAIASVVIELLKVSRDMGFGEALVYQKEESPEAIDTAHTILVGFSVVLFLVAAAAAPFAARYYGDPQITLVLIVMSSNLIWDSTRTVPRTLYRKRIDFKQLVIPEIVPVFIATLVSVVMALYGFGVWSLVARTVLHSVLGMVLLNASGMRVKGLYYPRFRFHRASAVALFAYGRFIIGTTVVLVVLYNLDKFFISTTLGLAAVGIYELASRISDLPVKEVSFVVGSVMFPVFAKMSQTNALQQAFLKTLKYTALVSMPMAIGISVFGPPVISQVYGEKWIGLNIPLQVLSLYAAFRSMSSIVHDMFKATGRPQLMQRFTLIKLVCIAVLGIPALKLFGLVGMCGLILVTYAATFFAEIYTVSKLVHVNFLVGLAVPAKPLAFAIAVIPTTYLAFRMAFGPLSLVLLVSGMVTAGTLYLLAVYVFDHGTVRELRRLTQAREAA